MDKKVSLREMFDIKYLQDLQDTFSELVRVAVLILDDNGQPITQPSHLVGCCNMIYHTPVANHKCLQADVYLTNVARQKKHPIMSKCPYSGYTISVVPIFLGEQYLGCWMIAQIKIYPLSRSEIEKNMRATAKETGISYKTLMDNLHLIPELPEDELFRMFEFLQEFSSLLAEFGRQHFELAQKNQELLELTARQQSTEDMLRLMADSAGVSIYISDFETGEILMANKIYCDELGLSHQEVLGSKCWRFGEPGSDTFCSDCPREQMLDEEGCPNGRVIEWETFNDFVQQYLKISHQAVYWMDGRLAHMATILDVTQEREMQKKLAELAFIDPMTGLPNALKLEQDFQEKKRNDLFLICYDIIALRRINDAYGRASGDELLKQVADWVGHVCKRHTITIYRVESDTFCLMIEGIHRQGCREVAGQIEQRFSSPWKISFDEEQISIFCEATLCIIPSVQIAGADSLQNLVERTLEYSRTQGNTVLYTDALDREFRRHSLLEVELKKCIRDGMAGFHLCYQPIVNPDTGIWQGLEALCRWDSPQFGCIPPLVFIEIAEKSGLIRTLGKWIFSTAIRDCKRWRLDEKEGFFIDINVSPAQLSDEKMVDSVIQLLKEAAFPPDKVSVEVTESVEVNFDNYTMDTIHQLKKAGLMVALDDFGTGYSSFNNLKNMPVDILKTEKKFIDTLEEDEYLQSLCRLMIQLAHTAGMKLVAEGVERQGQIAFLRKSGVDFLQGYAFCKPLPAAELELQLEKFDHANQGNLV